MSRPNDPTRTCSQCGAAPKEADAAFCAYCAAELPPKPIPERLPRSTSERFVALAAHVEAAPRRPGPHDAPPRRLGGPGQGDSTLISCCLPGLAFSLIAFFLFLKAVGVDEIQRVVDGVSTVGWLVIIGMGGALLIVTLLIGSAGGQNPGGDGPRDEKVGLLLLDRTAGDPRQRAPDRLLFERPDGTRRTVHASPLIGTELAPGDMVVAWIRLDELVGVRRASV